MDYYDAITIVRHISWERFTEDMRAQGKRLVLMTTRGSEIYTEFAFHRNDVLLFGRESMGVPDYVREAADAAVRIPLAAGLRSLNLALSVSMVLGEALRQTKGFP